MKLSLMLFLLGLAANACTVLLYFAGAELPNTSGWGMIFVLFVFPAIWVVFFVIAVVLIINFRNKALPDSMTLRVLAFVLCTPIPIIALTFGMVELEDSRTERLSSSVDYRNGIAYKFEDWQNVDGAAFVYRYFKADSVRLLQLGDDTYVKDSTWVYLNLKLDTLKLEIYRNDTLVRTITR